MHLVVYDELKLIGNSNVVTAYVLDTTKVNALKQENTLNIHVLSRTELDQIAEGGIKQAWHMR